MFEFNLHLSPLTFTFAFPLVLGDFLTAKYNKICALRMTGGLSLAQVGMIYGAAFTLGPLACNGKGK